MKTFCLIPVFAALLLVMGACEEEDVGIECQMAGIGDGKKTLIDAQALDCRSRLCLYWGNSQDKEKAFCTQTCKTESDCPDETVGCPEGYGYACRYGMNVGDALRCCKVCVCKRDVSDEEDPYRGVCEINPNNKCPTL
ncbi:MAG: hypothetical protein V1754_15895 [Pseudomonadota bacterium]